MRRGHKYTKAQQAVIKEKFIEVLIKEGGIITPTCKAVHISRQTILDWRKEDPEFDKACNEAIEVFIDEAESKLYSAVRRGNFKAIRFFLESKARGRGYDRHQEIDMTATVIRPRVVFEGEEDGLQD